MGKLTPFGEAVKKILVEKEMTQRDLSREMHISYKYLHLIFYGYRSGEKYIGKIANFLDIDLQKFLKAS